MRSLFNGYYRPTAADFKELWSQGTFVFDTNVLLTSYLFPQASREAFHSVLSQLASRVWIPYHVALEFQRNRITRIKDAGRKLESAEKILNSARTLPELVRDAELEKRGVSEPGLPEALETYSNALQRIATALTKAKERLPSLSLDDTIRDRLSEVFKDHIGAPPADQSALSKLISDADQRYNNEVPPGYMDASKSSTTKFMDRGIYYEAKYGDLIIWKQLLDQIRSARLKSVVLVTEDKKEDWWSIERGKTLGPRPELVQEALQAMGDSGGLFWIYSLEQFMEFAGEHLKAAVVPQEAIQQVREVSATYGVSDTTEIPHHAFSKRTDPAIEAALAVQDWVVETYNVMDIERHISLTTRAIQDLVVRLGSELWLLNVVAVGESKEDIHNRLAELTTEPRVESVSFRTVVLVLRNGDPMRVAHTAAVVRSHARKIEDNTLSLLVGSLRDGNFRVEQRFGSLPPFL